MNYTVILNLVSLVFFVTAIFRLTSNRRKVHLTVSEFIPLLISLLLYAFVVFSNVLEQSFITAYFDEAEDVVEIIFPLVFIFFANNWRQQRSLVDLQRQEAWLRVTLESLGDGVMTTDQQGKVCQLNKGMEDLSGWSRNDAVGVDAGQLLDFIDPKTSRPINFNPFHEVLHSVTGLPLVRSLHLRSSDGRTTSISEKTTIIRSHNDELLGAVGVYRDMTEYDSMMEQLTHIHKMDAIGQLAGGVAHDFNNMLAGIMGAADLLAAKMTLDEQRKYGNLLKLIVKASEGASDLTSNLLSFSRKGKILSSPILIQDVLDNTLAIAERTIDKKIRLEKHFPADPLRVIGDPTQLQNCFLNLILNARDAMPGKGTITLSTGIEQCDPNWCDLSGFQVEPGSFVFVEVQDDGSGFPDEIQKKIFEPFYTTKIEGKGTGLGLAAVYGTVCSHNGAITLKSRPGQGSSFRIYLPTANHNLDNVPGQPDQQEELGKGIILIIEDEAVVRAAAQMILEHSGYTTLVASTGIEGVEMYRKYSEEISAVLLDIIMPEMDGNEVLTELKHINPKVQVILSSGFPRKELISENISGFLKKPYRKDDLVKIVHEVIVAHN